MNHSSKLSTAALISAMAVVGMSSTASAQHVGRHRRAAQVQVQPRAHTTGATSLDGRLTARDAADEEGHHQRVRMLSLHRGDQVEYGLTSEDMDVLARVEGPDGQQWEDDDGAGGTDAMLRFTAPADGTYRFIATTYEAGATGAFHVEVSVQPGGAVTDPNDANDDSDDDSADDGAVNDPSNAPAPAAAAGAGRTFGVFVGITDNGGENDLPGSADDAVQLARSFEQAGWMQRSNAVVLTDREATPANIRAAFARLAPQVRPNDTFVFFYDGHGDVSELGTRNGSLSRSELDALLGRVSGREIVVLDSCHAGGFASIIRGHANRYGLFSSRANELSSTAPAVNAGGWLAYFFRQAIAGGVRRGPDGTADYASVVQYVQSHYDQRNISREQHLVAVNGGPQTFALGGPNAGGAPIDDNGTAVATNAPVMPTFPGAMPTGVNGLPSMPSLPSLPSLPALNEAQMAQYANLGVAVANSVLTSLVK